MIHADIYPHYHDPIEKDTVILLCGAKYVGRNNLQDYVKQAFNVSWHGWDSCITCPKCIEMKFLWEIKKLNDEG